MALSKRHCWFIDFGPGCVYLFNKIPHLVTLFERALRLFENRMYIVHALLFTFLADAYTLFQGSQNILKIIIKGH